MTLDVELGPAAALGQATVAGLSDQRCLQRAPTREIVVLRPLGEGAYSWVDLVALPVRPAPAGRPGAQRPYKLCAGKLLIPEPLDSSEAPAVASSIGNGGGGSGLAAAAAVVAAQQPGCALARWTASAETARGPVKPTPPCAFAKQKTAHAACAGSPFVVQLLACKQGRAGHMLLLLEFAEHGSLADFLPDDEEEGLTMHEDDAGGNDNGSADAALTAAALTAAAGSAAAVGSAAAAATGVAAEDAAIAAVAQGLAPVTPEPQHDCGCGPAGRRSRHTKRRPAAAAAEEQEEGSSSGSESGSGSGSGFASRGGSFSARTASGVLGEETGAAASLGDSSSTISSSTISSSTISSGSSSEAATAPAGGGPQQPEPTPPAADGRASPAPAPAGGGGMPEAAARFYAACTLEALSHLHARSVLHRDVKPANLLLFSSGYLKLSDLGAACVVPPGHAPTTRSGTAAFMSPECKAARPQCAAADMWSLGVTLWQLVAGRLPAWAEEEGGHAGLEFPEHFSEDLRSLLGALLRHKPRDRPTVEAARHHPFFKGLDWQALREQRLPPPPVPPRPAPRERERRLLRRRCARCGGLRAVTAATAAATGEGTAAAAVDAAAVDVVAVASAAMAAPAAE